MLKNLRLAVSPNSRLVRLGTRYSHLKGVLANQNATEAAFLQRSFASLSSPPVTQNVSPWRLAGKQAYRGFSTAASNPPSRWRWVPLAIIASGSATGYFLLDYLGRTGFTGAAYPSWNSEWDFSWLPYKHTPPTSQDEPGGKKRPFRSTRQIILLRHGQYENVGEKDDDKQGLTTLGRQQAEATGARLAQLLSGKKVRAVYCSDMKRARETAGIISKHIPSVPLIEDHLLAEGVPEFPEPPLATFNPTETEVELDSARIETAFRKLFYRPPTPTQPALQDGDHDIYEIVVCHGNVIRYFFCRALQFPANAWLRLAVFNCGLTWIAIDNEGSVSARALGDTGHLKLDEVTYH